MIYNVFTPVAPLKPYIKCFWHLQGFAGPDVMHREKILPDGCIEMIIHYGDAFKRIHTNNVTETQPGSFIIGQIKHYIEVAPAGNIGVIGIRFYPAGLSAFTKIPVYAFTGQTISLDNIFGKTFNGIEDVMQGLGDAEKINLLQTLLVKQLTDNKKYDFVIDNIVKNIILHKGQVNLYALLKKVKISERHFERKFKQAVGINPKFFARLVRFNNIMQELESNSDEKFVSLTYLGGYYDQAHFIKDFKQFTGENPGDYFKGNHAMASVFLA